MDRRKWRQVSFRKFQTKIPNTSERRNGVMNTSTKPKSSNTDAAQQVREMTETGAQQSKEVFEKISMATSEAAQVMTNCCSAALKGMQDYNSKLIEFTQVNAKSH